MSEVRKERRWESVVGMRKGSERESGEERRKVRRKTRSQVGR